MLALLALLLAAPDAGVGPRYEDDQSVVVLSGGQIEITIKTGFHLNDEYPINFKPEGGGPKVEKKQMALSACAGHPEEKCGVKIPLAPKTTGGTVAFAACDPKICLIKKVPLALK